jgi:hypothetical protein
MDYKRRLGHRVLPRRAFLGLLRATRGAFTVGPAVGDRVRVRGLQARPDLNGLEGAVVAVVASRPRDDALKGAPAVAPGAAPAPSASRRYVEVDGRGQFNLSVTNLTVVGPTGLAEVPNGSARADFTPLPDGAECRWTELLLP